jgi:hypothetical protein
VQRFKKRRMYSRRLSPTVVCSCTARTAYQDPCMCPGSCRRKLNAGPYSLGSCRAADARATCIGVAEVERQILDHEEIVGRPTSVACKSVVLEPHTRVGVPVVSRYVGRSPEAQGELRIMDALAKSRRTPLVR